MESRLSTRKRSRKEGGTTGRSGAHLWPVMATPEELYRDDDKGEIGGGASRRVNSRRARVYYAWPYGREGSIDFVDSWKAWSGPGYAIN